MGTVSEHAQPMWPSCGLEVIPLFIAHMKCSRSAVSSPPQWLDADCQRTKGVVHTQQAVTGVIHTHTQSGL